MRARFPYQKLKKYPHLRPEDVVIWERFIEMYPDFFERVNYDVRCGEGRSYPLVEDEKILHDIQGLSKLRIDVVGFRAKERWVIELKPRAGASAIGQVMCYANLFKDLCAADTKITMAVITDEAVPDIERIAASFGVRYVALNTHPQGHHPL